MKLQAILNTFPKSKGEKIDWLSLEKTTLSPVFNEMAKTMQFLEYHGEGDVYTHTKMVCEAMILDDEYWELNEKQRSIMLLSALLHDIGKIKCTRVIDGLLASPHHAKTGSIVARELLWRELSLCGTEEKQNMRESVCAYIKYHSYPPYAIDNRNPSLKLIRVASQGKLATDFSIKNLCLLERADINGRISEGREEFLEKIECCKILAEENGCLENPYKFADSFTERAYYKEQLNFPNGTIFNDTWGEVIVLSGLPGTGKDTYIESNYPNMPVISLDQIRIEKNISPTGNQSEVVQIAKERARELLRKKQVFIWNATNITEQLRMPIISLFEDYGASVKIIFLETDWAKQLSRNSSRKAEVPRAVIEKMLSKLEIPENYEAKNVIWQIT